MADNKTNAVTDAIEVAPAVPSCGLQHHRTCSTVQLLSPIVDLANRSSRSTIAVIDTVVQRGGFRGEELSTIGQLRDQCVQIVALAETEMQNLAQE